MSAPDGLEAGETVVMVNDSAPEETEAAVSVTPPVPNWIVASFTAALMGLVFGTAFAKSHVYEPGIIRDQFLFRRWIMLKMFVGAMGSGALCLSVLSKFAPVYFESTRQKWEGTSRDRGWLTGSVLGCAILGAGMATAGACPGMVLSQIGSGVPNSGVTFAGGLVGALVYGLLQSHISKAILKKGPAGPDAVYLDRMINKPYWMVGTGLSLCCIGACVLMEALVPWKSELPLRLASHMATCSSFIDCPAWPPSLAGGLLGLLQLPAVMLVQTFLGSATSYQVTCSWWVGACSNEVKEKLPYMTAFSKPNIKSWWQVPYVWMAVLASLLWAMAANDLGSSAGVDVISAFIGGFLMVFGARWAGGCTSGHGISGCAIMMATSYLAVGAMFGSGIATAMIWNYGVGGFLVAPWAPVV